VIIETTDLQRTPTISGWMVNIEDLSSIDPSLLGLVFTTEILQRTKEQKYRSL
jgi:hypothetical protein